MWLNQRGAFSLDSRRNHLKKVTSIVEWRTLKTTQKVSSDLVLSKEKPSLSPSSRPKPSLLHAIRLLNIGIV